MAFAVKDWKDEPDHSTPISASALKDLERRLSDYSDDGDIAIADQIRIMNLGTDWSDGDLITITPGQTGNVGFKGDIRHGTAASPIVGQESTIKISRTTGTTQAQHDAWPGVSAGGQNQDTAALAVAALGTSSCEIQVSAISAIARNAGTRGQPDACPLFTYAWQKDAGAIGRAISAYSAARNDLAGGKLTGYEIQAQNNTGSYINTNNVGVSDAVALLLSAGSSVYQGGGAGIQFHHPTGWALLDGGIASSSNDGGPFRSYFTRDNSNALISHEVRGTHDTAAIAVDNGSGGVIIGALTSGFVGRGGTGALLDVVTGGDISSLGIFRTSLSTGRAGLQASGPTGDVKIARCGARDNYMTGTVQGDSVLVANSSFILHIGQTGRTPVIKVGAGLGFYGRTPAAQSAAYTQTYATTTRTNANPTAAAVATTAAALASYGFTQAQADSIPVAINALVADMANIKQLVNSIIDDFQANGMFA